MGSTRGVSKAQLRAAIYQQRGRIIDACIRNGDKAFEYNYEQFYEDVIRSDILRDDRTIKAKWKQIQKDGTVIASDDGTTSLSVYAFARIAYESACEREINAKAFIDAMEGAQ